MANLFFMLPFGYIYNKVARIDSEVNARFIGGKIYNKVAQIAFDGKLCLTSYVCVDCVILDLLSSVLAI